GGKYSLLKRLRVAPSASPEEGDQLTYHICTLASSGVSGVYISSDKVPSSMDFTSTSIPISANCCCMNCIPLTDSELLFAHISALNPSSYPASASNSLAFSTSYSYKSWLS